MESVNNEVIKGQHDILESKVQQVIEAQRKMNEDNSDEDETPEMQSFLKAIDLGSDDEE